jgi:hypothetical protein
MSQSPVTQHFKFSVGHKNNCMIDSTKKRNYFSFYTKITLLDWYDLLMKFLGPSPSYQFNRVTCVVICSLLLTHTIGHLTCRVHLPDCFPVFFHVVGTTVDCYCHVIWPTISLPSSFGCLRGRGVCLSLFFYLII